MDYLSITTDKEVVFLYNFRSPPLFFPGFKNNKNKIYHHIIKFDFHTGMLVQLDRHLPYRYIILLSVGYNPASITLNISQITGLISIIAIFSN